MSEYWTHIHFDLSKVTMDELWNIETKLRRRGVSFDTGCTLAPNGPREWHTDWSLEGPMSVEDITNYLDEENIDYSTVKVAK